MKRFAINDMKQFATMLGGHFRSPIYLGIHAKHEWECSQGHLFKSTPNNVRSGRWCPVCFDQTRGARIKRSILQQHGLNPVEPHWSPEQLMEQHGRFLVLDVALLWGLSMHFFRQEARTIEKAALSSGIQQTNGLWIIELPKAKPFLERLLKHPSRRPRTTTDPQSS